MTLSAKKYTDPTGVLRAITDDQGQAIEIGEQKDMGEFNQTLLARIQDGLMSQKLIQRYFMEIQVEKAADEDVKMKEEEKSDANMPQSESQNDTSMIEKDLKNEDVIMKGTESPLKQLLLSQEKS